MRLRNVAVLLISASACGAKAGDNGDGGESSSSEGVSEGASVESTTGGGGDALQPFRDEWRLEADLPFPYGSPDAPGITRIDVGGLLYSDNFENRGDVIVSFTGPADRILIEVRRFTKALDVEHAAEQFALLSLWAYDVGGSTPSKPSDMPEENNCLGANWLDQCTLRVYFDGLTQLARLGADLRVTLPANYRHELNVITNDADNDEPVNHGNVCIDNLGGSAQVLLQSGIAFATLAADAVPAPACSSAQTQACVDADWATGCGCDTFGRLAVETDAAGAAIMMIDLPASLWAYVDAENTGPGQDPNGEHCTATITVRARSSIRRSTRINPGERVPRSMIPARRPLQARALASRRRRASAPRSAGTSRCARAASATWACATTSTTSAATEAPPTPAARRTETLAELEQVPRIYLLARMMPLPAPLSSSIATQ